jgi:hypothetical protein
MPAGKSQFWNVNECCDQLIVISPQLEALPFQDASEMSLLNVEYFNSARLSLREKKFHGCQVSFTGCWNVPPMCVLEPSVARAKAALEAGWESNTAVTSTCLLQWKVLSIASNHLSNF